MTPHPLNAYPSDGVSLASADVANAVASEPVPMLLGAAQAYAAALEEVERDENGERFDGLG